MTFKPLHDRLLVERYAEAPAPSGATVIPDSAQEKPHLILEEDDVLGIHEGRR